MRLKWVIKLRDIARQQVPLAEREDGERKHLQAVLKPHFRFKERVWPHIIGQNDVDELRVQHPRVELRRLFVEGIAADLVSRLKRFRV